ncbi:uncharacterized protein LOC132754587 [Ruditapes philippinarum]|uniref:uncharacterized protein LOC132754587 n=1 Tax=Ruditapes philippinarum TaxID=129788 RepID=UPI00295B802C|nr:uncharacterized protein LOC132754587 [Ruditapes philippinarum]
MDFHERCSSWVFKLIILAFVFSCTFIAKFGIHLKSFKVHVTDEKPREDRNQTPVCQSNRVDDIPEKTKLPPLLKDFKCPCWIERNTFDSATRVRCLPYFYLVGMPKCGTTDFFSRITYHPSISNKSKKETHWFSRRRFNINGKYR